MVPFLASLAGAGSGTRPLRRIAFIFQFKSTVNSRNLHLENVDRKVKVPGSTGDSPDDLLAPCGNPRRGKNEVIEGKPDYELDLLKARERLAAEQAGLKRMKQLDKERIIG